MTAPLLASKFFLPPTPPRFVPRPRLLARLREGLDAKLVLLSAPPGYGKTTLLSEWIHVSGVTAAWLSLDEADNDPARFLSCLIAAFQSLGMRLNEHLLASSPTPQLTLLEPTLSLLLNAASSSPQSIVIVLDDYHLISEQPIQRGMSYFIDHLTPNLHLIIATREDPPLPLPRLRARGQLVEVRAADLCMTMEEASAFIKDAMRLRLSDEDIATLLSKAEGWVAGLQMAALSLREHADASAFVNALSGSHRYILDYLADEILAQQPKPILDFLYRTCILDQLCAPLCNALWNVPMPSALSPNAGIAASQEVLEHIESANMFLTPLDEERHWYRYHRLFADLLKYRLQHDQPELIPDLHRRAAHWLEQNDQASEAIHHYVAASDYTAAADLIEQVAQTLLWQRGEVTTLTGWLQTLPAELIAARPRLTLLDAWLALTTVALARVTKRITEAERAVPGEPATSRESLERELAVIKAMLSNFQGDLPRTIELSKAALDRLSPENHLLRGIILGNLGGAYASSGQAVRAAQAFAEGAALAEQSGQTFLGLISLAYHGEMEILQGHLHAAERPFRRALDWAADLGVSTLPVAALANVGMGGLLYEWDRLDDARQYAEIGIAAGERQDLMLTGWAGMALVNGYLLKARIATANGQFDEARESLSKIRTLVLKHMPASLNVVEAAEARLALACGDLQAGVRWAARAGLRIDSAGIYARESEFLVLARILLAQAMGDEAERLLELLSDGAERSGRSGITTQVMVLQALAYDISGRAEESFAVLKRALARAETEGYVRLFLDAGAPLLALFERLLVEEPNGPHTSYILALLASSANQAGSLSVGAQGAPVKGPQPHTGMIESLSARELEILRLVALGLSNQEIAERLVITVPTVKKHLTNVFGKLNVTSRTLAVAKGREMGILQ